MELIVKSDDSRIKQIEQAIIAEGSNGAEKLLVKSLRAVLQSAEALAKECDETIRMYDEAEKEMRLTRGKLLNLETELESERMRLAACSTAAIQNTPKTATDRIGAENLYWSAAYADVCRAVDREMAHREKATRLEKVAEDVLKKTYVDFPNGTYVGKNYTLAEARAALAEALR